MTRNQCRRLLILNGSITPAKGRAGVGRTARRAPSAPLPARRRDRSHTASHARVPSRGAPQAHGPAALRRLLLLPPPPHGCCCYSAAAAQRPLGSVRCALTLRHPRHQHSGEPSPPPPPPKRCPPTPRRIASRPPRRSATAQPQHTEGTLQCTCFSILFSVKHGN